MEKWIISASGKVYNHASAFAKFGYIDWIQSANFQVGDEVYIYCARPVKKLMYRTKVVAVNLPFEAKTDDKEFWSDLSRYESGKSGRFARLMLIEQTDNENLSLDKLLAHGLRSAPQNQIRMKAELSEYVDRHMCDTLLSDAMGEEIINDDTFEGARKTVLVNKYERSSIARMKCIEHHGCKCSICGFDFEKAYGELGKGFIHVHHLVPLATIGKEYRVDYDRDLIPVCPNCHAMLHRNVDGNHYSVADLKKIVNQVCG